MRVEERPKPAGADLAGLIAEVAGRDEAALRVLYDRTAAKLLGVVLRIVRDRASAEDVLQDAYLRIWQSAPSYAPETGSPMAWLVAIARNRAIDVVRRRTEVAMPDGEDGEDWLARIADPRDEEAAVLDRKALLSCLAGLDVTHRECIVLAYCEGLSREELAARYAKPVNTVKTWLHRGLAALRLCLDAAA
ncbi:sigma-70 family RNA polymerase sigma factor [Methylobacterium sp. JK268]